eukprot:COSAG06_NODE_28688_length_569_cov_3604.576596_1_plen_81_part_00
MANGQTQEEMGHEICSFGPTLYEPIFTAIATAAGRSGNPATGSAAAEPEPEAAPEAEPEAEAEAAPAEEGVPPEDDEGAI